MRDQHGFFFEDPPAPANAAVQGPAAPGRDADVVLGDYLALDVSERARFMLLLDESEQGFELPTLRKLNAALSRAKAPINDRPAYERVLSQIGARLAGIRLFDEAESPADGVGAAGLRSADAGPAVPGDLPQARGRMKGAPRP